MRRYMITGILRESGERLDLFALSANSPRHAVIKAGPMIALPWRQRLVPGSLEATPR